jgi:hypothetical protein
VKKVRGAVMEMRGGKMNESEFGARFDGKGQRWTMIHAVFDMHCKRLGLNQDRLEDEGPSTFAKPKRQLSLFDG